jgi:acetoin utilization deacetylase AcuC-like enzyme
MAGGSMLAVRLALEARRVVPAAERPALAAAANLGGGFHHAFPAHGEGFCLFNDIAVAIRAAQRDGLVTRVAVVDCDVHQGNGTAFTFDADDRVFTFSIHQEHNYPAIKPPGSLDVGLPDGAGDYEYLRALEAALPTVMASHPEVIVYVAGADPYQDDQLGGLNLTFEGLRGRDYLVLDTARSAGLPVAIVFAGGYARSVDDTAAIHAATIAEAVRLGA